MRPSASRPLRTAPVAAASAEAAWALRARSGVAQVAQPHERVEHQRGLDVRRDAVPRELGVEQRHVVVDRVVAAQQRRHAAHVGRGLAREVPREAGAHLGEGGRPRHGAAVEAVHLGRLLRDGHSGVAKHAARRAELRGAPPVGCAELDDAIGGSAQARGLRVEDQHDPLRDLA
eukprot:scaffold27205_cov63-Phaeocystis_antarctica.AAC.1